MKMFSVTQEQLCKSASHNKLHFIQFNNSPAGFVPTLPPSSRQIQNIGVGVIVFSQACDWLLGCCCVHLSEFYQTCLHIGYSVAFNRCLNAFDFVAPLPPQNDHTFGFMKLYTS